MLLQIIGLKRRANRATTTAHTINVRLAGSFDSNPQPIGLFWRGVATKAASTTYSVDECQVHGPE